MKEHRVELDGTTTVQAENPEQAEQKAEDVAWENPDRVEYLNAEAHPLNAEKDYFFCHLREVGDNKSSAGYNLFKDKSALNVAFRSSANICDAMGGTTLRFKTAIMLLSTIEEESIDWEEVQQRVKEIQEKVKELDVEDPYAAITSTDHVAQSRTDEVNEEHMLPSDKHVGGDDEQE